MRLISCLYVLFLLSLPALASDVPRQASVYFDASDLNWDQRCMLEALQGIVNRSGPRLFLNSPAWDMTWDNQWVDIYTSHNNLKFRKDIRDIPTMLRFFKDDVRGFIVYDPKVDGSRYMAMTLSGIENLLPVSPGLLEGFLPNLEEPWTGVDFSKIDVYQLMSAWGAGLPQSCWDSQSSLREGAGVECMAVQLADGKAKAGCTLDYGPLLLDTSACPVMEVSIDALQGGTWQVQLIIGEKTIMLDGGSEKTKTWDLAAQLKTTGKVEARLLRLVLNGKGGSVTWKSVRFLDAKNQYVPIKAPTELTKQLPLAVKQDFRGKFPDTLSAYEWGLKNLLPRCDTGYAHTVDGIVDGHIIGSGPWKSCDFAVMKKGFIFNLSFNDKDTFAFGITYKAEPNQARMYRKILTSLKQPAFITGYGDCENDWFPLMNEYGHAYLVPQYCNASFHAAVKPNNPHPRQKKHYTPDDVTVDAGKYYVCFISSDGDTLKGPVSQHYQSWNKDPNRGTFPFTFAMPLCMGRYFPAMLEYYYDTATDNDYFTGCAVWKLNSSEKAAPGLYAHIAEDMKFSDYDTINNVAIEPDDPNKYELFNQMLHPLGVAQVIWWHGTGYGETFYTRDGTPVITNPDWFGYCRRATNQGRWETPSLSETFKDKAAWKITVQKLVDYCDLCASKHKPPFVIIIFPSLHHHFTQYSICSDIAAALDKNKYKVVRFDEASAIMKKYHQEQK